MAPADLGGQSAIERRDQLHRQALWIALGIAVILEAVLLFRASALTPVDSDRVENVLEVSDILRGNVLLHGWVLARDNFYLSDNPFYLVTRLLFGRSLTAIYAAPFLIYATFLVAAGGIVCLQTRRGVERAIGLAAILFYLGTPGLDGINAVLLVGGQHIAALTFCTLAWLALEAAGTARRPGSAAGFAALYACCAVIALMSDPFAIIVFFVPTALGLLLALMVAERRRWNLGLLGLMVAALFGAILALRGIRLAGGFVTMKNTFLEFANPEQFGRNAAGLLFGLLKISGAYFFGETLGRASSFIALIRLAGLWFLLAAVIGTVHRALTRAEGWNLRCVLAFAVLIDLGSSLTSREFTAALVPSVWDGGAAIRYLTPTILFGGILAALELPAALERVRVPEWRRLWLGLSGAAVIFAAGLFAWNGVARWRDEPAIAVAPGQLAGQWLLRHGLTHGVGGYWEGLLITTLTRERVLVRAVTAENGRLVPYIWVTNRTWYRNQPRPQFVIYAPGNGYGVNAQSIAATYGPPSAITRVAGYDVALLPAAGGAGGRLR